MDELFSALADSQCRQILGLLLDRSRQRADGGEEILYPTKEFPEESRIELHHNHLPRLADAGFINWNQTADKVMRGPRFNEIRPFLKQIDNANGSPEDQA